MYFGFYATFYVLVLIALFVAGFLVLLRHRAALYRYFATFSFSIGAWQGFQFVAQLLHSDPGIAIPLAQVSVATGAMMSACISMFARSYTGRKVYMPVFVLGGLAFGSLAFLSGSLRTSELTNTSFSVNSLDPYYLTLLIFCAACAIYGTAIIAEWSRRATDLKVRRQAKTLAIAIGQATLIILAFSIYTAGDIAQFMILASCFTVVATFVYTMLYQGLFDIRFYVVRAAAYLTTLFVVTILLVAPLVLAVIYFLDVTISTQQTTLFIVGSVVAYYLIQFARTHFSKLINRIFFRRYYDPQAVIERLNKVLVRTSEPAYIRGTTIKIIRDIFEPSFARYLLFESENQEDSRLAREIALHGGRNSMIIADNVVSDNKLFAILKSNDIAVCIKLRVARVDLGFLVLGYRRSGQMYGVRELALLSIIADNVSIGLQNVLRFEEIKRLNTAQEDIINAKTRELRIKNERLRKLDHTKDDFISMASHQLRTPLTSVKGYVSMVLDGDAGPISESQRKLLMQAFISSQRMVGLISDLLNVSRLKTGKFVIEPTECDLSKIVDEEVGQLQETVSGRGLELTYAKPEHFPVLMLDETKIRQVIMNFIDNAIYYTPSGGHIEVKLVEKSDSVEFTVTDDGIGVPRHEQHHLFTKFFRAHNARTARPDGTGLGLFMAKKVVVAQGGAILFKSTLGKGSTFGFTFPKAKLLPQAAPDPAKAATAKK